MQYRFTQTILHSLSGKDSTYAEGTSTQYNFVNGFQNELSNGKHDYIIGSNNKVSGESVDKNQSNIIFGDNHKLTGQNNNVIIGSSDTADDETKVSNAVIEVGWQHGSVWFKYQ